MHNSFTAFTCGEDDGEDVDAMIGADAATAKPTNATLNVLLRSAQTASAIESKMRSAHILLSIGNVFAIGCTF